MQRYMVGNIKHMKTQSTMGNLCVIVQYNFRLHYVFPCVVVMLRLYAGGGAAAFPPSSLRTGNTVLLIYPLMTKYVMGRLIMMVTIKVTTETEP